MDDNQDDALLDCLNSGGELPRFAIFKELADEWHKRHPGKRNIDLSELLGARPQAVSQWKSGSDPRRRPPWRAIITLCSICRKQVVITPDGVSIKRLRKSKKTS